MSSNTVTLLEGIAIGFGLGGTIFYLWGYREGVAWCVRQTRAVQGVAETDRSRSR